MLGQVKTVAFLGVETREIFIQVHIADGGLPCFNIVGLADKSVAESRERVRAAFTSIGLSLPPKRITVNLAPADILKEGSHFDLGIAAGILIAMQIIPQEEIEQYIVMGELALDGGITRVNGALPAAIKANEYGMGIICPAHSGAEATLSGNKTIIAPKHLLELINHLKGIQFLLQPQSPEFSEIFENSDLCDVKGQALAKRALEIAAAGNHNMLMMGPPGAGKSMLAKRLASIMPPLTTGEKLEITIIASIAGLLDQKNPIMQQRPFRDPHCSASTAAIIGGGKNIRPGEITLAHLGVLFLDELPEFARSTLEALRQPLEAGYVNIARVNSHIKYPTKFQLIAAMNPCRCGYYNTNNNLMCRKAPRCAEEYQALISGPLFDRFDLHVEVTTENILELHRQNIKEETSANIRQRVIEARIIQQKRYQKLDLSIQTNADLSGEALIEVVQIDNKTQKLLKDAMIKFSLSARGFYRVLRLARTIADLAHQENVTDMHIAEALSYRMRRIRSQ